LSPAPAAAAPLAEVLPLPTAPRVVVPAVVEDPPWGGDDDDPWAV
jgi:hypothetical protein